MGREEVCDQFGLFVCLQSSVDGFQDITFKFSVMVDTNSSKVKVTPCGGSCSLSALVGVAVAEVGGLIQISNQISKYPWARY